MKMDSGGPACDFRGQRLMCSVYRMWDRERHYWRIEKPALVVDVGFGAVLPKFWCDLAQMFR